MKKIRPWLMLGWLLLQPPTLFAEEPVIPDPAWEVARAQFTTGISNREPVDEVVVATPLISEVYFFTDLRRLEGRTVMHRWEYEGRVVSQVPFKVGGPRWRVNSKKVIDPDQVGEWSVTVVDESGWPLYTELFRYENGAPLLLSADAPATVTAGSSGVVKQEEVPAPPATLVPAPPADPAPRPDATQSPGAPVLPAAEAGISTE